jgi:acyl-homoserine lactone acylase PvdQ
MRDILNDTLSSVALEAKAQLEGLVSSDPAVERARLRLLDWDGRMTKESAAAAIFFEWRRARDEGGAEARLSHTLDALRSSQGEDESDWRWGRIHRSEFPHPLASAFDIPAVERNGGADTVNATGAVYRLVTDFSDLDRSLAIIAPGQSGQPESPYYANLLEMWVRGEMFELPYSREAVEREAAHWLVLRPR